MDDGTTFHFIDASPAEALEAARSCSARGVRLWDGLESIEKDYRAEATSSPSGVTHVTFTRAAA
ncbi:MAG TPA: hypothetical protein VGM79_13815 [Streptosporangiaceae bacterium]|jgi:hypothetical protein